MPLIVPAAVEPPVTLEELKEHLNLSATSTANDVELQMHLDAAIIAIEKRIGPVVNREFTERLESRGGKLAVTHTPLVAVTSLTEVTGDVLWSSATYSTHSSGVVTGTNGWSLTRGSWDITYTAGHGDTINADHKLAILYVAEHLWEMQRKSGVSRPGLMGEAGDTSSSTGEAAAGFVYRGFALPRRALELISGDEEIGFA